MIKDNEKRRIVASKLRRLCSDGTPECFVWLKAKKIISSENEYRCKDMSFLANLIDRDTCKNVGVNGYTFQCSACYKRVFIEPCGWSYCPHCGAEIVDPE